MGIFGVPWNHLCCPFVARSSGVFLVQLHLVETVYFYLAGEGLDPDHIRQGQGGRIDKVLMSGAGSQRAYQRSPEQGLRQQKLNILPSSVARWRRNQALHWELARHRHLLLKLIQLTGRSTGPLRHATIIIWPHSLY